MKCNKFAILSSIAILVLLLFSCNDKSNRTIIKGSINNLEDSEILITYFLSDSLVIDTIWTNDKGDFSYDCVIDDLTSFSLFFNNQNSSVMLFANPLDKVSLKGDAQVFDLVKVNGNEINDDLTKFKEENRELITRRYLLYNNMLETNAVDSLNNGMALVHSDDEAKINNINLDLIMAAEGFIEKNPNRLSSLVLINEFFANAENSESFERVMSFVKGDILKTKMGLNLNTYLNKVKNSAEGSSMPYFKIIDVKGDTTNSYDYKGKHLLLSFVSATGSDSRENIKRLKDTYNNLNKDSVEFISIYIDSNIHPNEYIENDSIDWTIVYENKSWASDIVDAYNIEFVPNNILISPSGVISSRNISASAVAKELRNSNKNDQ